MASNHIFHPNTLESYIQLLKLIYQHLNPYQISWDDSDPGLRAYTQHFSTLMTRFHDLFPNDLVKIQDHSISSFSVYNRKIRQKKSLLSLPGSLYSQEINSYITQERILVSSMEDFVQQIRHRFFFKIWVQQKLKKLLEALFTKRTEKAEYLHVLLVAQSLKQRTQMNDSDNSKNTDDQDIEASVYQLVQLQSKLNASLIDHQQDILNLEKSIEILFDTQLNNTHKMLSQHLKSFKKIPPKGQKKLSRSLQHLMVEFIKHDLIFQLEENRLKMEISQQELLMIGGSIPTTSKAFFPLKMAKSIQSDLTKNRKQLFQLHQNHDRKGLWLKHQLQHTHFSTLGKTLEGRKLIFLSLLEHYEPGPLLKLEVEHYLLVQHSQQLRQRLEEAKFEENRLVSYCPPHSSHSKLMRP